MEGMEEKLGAILNDPEAMQKIMAMAQSLSAPAEAPESPASPGPDPGLARNLSALAGQGNIDANQKALLKALTPYLSRQRIRKLENAMRAAGMAKVASRFLGRQGGNLHSAR